jgi:outer membrane protein
MKSKFILGVLALFFASFVAQAQNQANPPLKIGYTNIDYILSLLPEAKQIESDYKAYEKQLTNQLQSKDQELRTKFEAYQKNAATMTDVVRADKEEELQNLQASLQKFQREAESSLQKKQVELFQPAYDKVGQVINEVAKENGFTHIFSDGVGGLDILLYANEESNISNLVLKKLGITPPAASTAPTN